MDEVRLISLNRDYPCLDEIERLYMTSFPQEERKPFEMILEGIERGLMKGAAVEIENRAAGLAFEILSKDHPVILDYLAIRPELRGQGFGSAVLSKLAEKSDLIVEIESTRTERKEALDRKRFYLKNGLKENNLEISLFGVDMEILSTVPVSFEDYFKIQAEYLEKMALPYKPERFIKER